MFCRWSGTTAFIQESVERPRMEFDIARFRPQVCRVARCLSESRQENSDLRAQLRSGRGREERKHPSRICLFEAVQADHVPAGEHSMLLMADTSFRMEILIDSVEASLRSNRFNPLSERLDKLGTG